MRETATRTRLLDAAERLLAEHGAAGTSVREVLSAAGVANAAAVGYYFGSKEALVTAVERRVVDRVVEQRDRALAALAAPATVEAVVDAWVRPLVELRCGGRGRQAAQVFFRIFDAPRESWPGNGADAVVASGRRYADALGPLLPDLAPVELWWRWQALTAVTAFYIKGALDDGQPDPGPGEVDVHVRRLVAPGAASLRASPAW